MADLLIGPWVGTWTKAISNKWARLVYGNDHGILVTETAQCVAPSQVPIGRKVIYSSFICNCQPLKTESRKVRLLVGEDILLHHIYSGLPASNPIKTKILLNSTISDV